jgi:predicted phosphodiesterase
MKLKKEVIVLGDIEIGAGNLTDDFISDKAISELFVELSKRPHSVDLILNGDTFDFLKCPIFKKNRFIYPRYITEEVSLSKLSLMYYAHQRFFTGLKEFVKNKKNKLYFTFGNHDYDIVYNGVQKEIKSFLGSSSNIFFKMKYQQNKIHVEHGHQYDLLNRTNLHKLLIHYKGKQILNLSFVSLSVISKFLGMKEDHPFMERVFPRLTLFSFHRQILRKLTVKSFIYFIKSLFYYPFRYYSDPTYSFPRDLVRKFIFKLMKFDWDVDNIVDFFKGRKSNTKIYVLGHVHEKYTEEKRGKVIIHPGSWRDEYDLDDKTRKLIPRSKRYVQILVYDGGNLEYNLIDYPVKRNIINFDKVLKDEAKYIKMVAKEEGFRSSFV